MGDIVTKRLRKEVSLRYKKTHIPATMLFYDKKEMVIAYATERHCFSVALSIIHKNF